MLQNFIRVDDLLTRDVVVQWFEGVALVQAVCEGLAPATADGGGFPGESQIVLAHDGSVGVLGAGAAHDAVPMAARVLARMLADDVPVRLRLLVTEAAAGTVYATIGDLSAALGYFERPDRPAILRQLYARASQAATRHDARLDPEPVRTPEPPPLPHPGDARKRKGSAFAVFTTVGVMVCAVITWAAFRMPEGNVSSAIESAREAVRASFTPQAQEEQTAQVAVTDSTAKPSPVRRTAAARNPGASRPALALLPPALTLYRSALLPISPAPKAPDTVFFSTVEVTAVSAEEVEAAQRQIYSASDPGVTPPHAVYPKLPASPPPSLARPDQTVLDMIIGTNGLVEGVRLRTSPRNIHEFMLLSAAKAWQFEPALHPDGYPVRFRHSIVLSSFP